MVIYWSIWWDLMVIYRIYPPNLPMILEIAIFRCYVNLPQGQKVLQYIYIYIYVCIYLCIYSFMHLFIYGCILFGGIVFVFVHVFSPAGALFLAILLVHLQGPWTAHNACLTPKRPEKCTVHRFFHGVHWFTQSVHRLFHSFHWVCHGFNWCFHGFNRFLDA